MQIESLLIHCCKRSRINNIPINSVV